jgi:hypothetical protein
MSENENLDANTNEGQGRPTFLTVLCILTFIGSGLGVLGGILGLVGSSMLTAFAPAAGGSMIWALLALVASILCLLGAIQMWGLKKMGFTLYLAGSAVSVIVTIINAATASSAVSTMSSSMNQFNSELGNEYAERNEQAMNAMGSAVSGVAWGSAIFGIIIVIAFVLMYNANRKHLVN